jgi:hypothetical protein
LKVDKFQSSTTGKWLEANKVEKFLSYEEFSREEVQAPAVNSDEPNIDTTPPTQTTEKKYSFG